MAEVKKKKARSGNPAVRALATPKDFKKKRGIVELTLPSGNVVKARNPGGMSLFMGEGVIPNRLMGIIQSSLDTGSQPDMAEALMNDDGTLDPGMISSMLELNDKVAMRCIVSPRVHPEPENEADRDDELLYIDELDDEDKMFIFNWAVGGTDDVAQFRQELTTTMDDMGAIQAVGEATK